MKYRWSNKWPFLKPRITSVILFIAVLFIAMQFLKKSPEAVIIGSKNFTEQILLAEMIAALIENDPAGKSLTVQKKLNLGGTFVCFNALKNNKLDCYVEYTGTGLTAILKKNPISNPDSVYSIVYDEFKKNWNIIWMQPVGFNNTYTLTMRKNQADSLGIQSISDCIKYRFTLRPGFNNEFLERPDGYQGLIKRYGFSFTKRPKEMNTGLMYQSIAGNKVDIICGFSTDGRIKAFNLVCLEDDKHFFPPYYAACLVRSELLDKHPELSNVLNRLSGHITNEEMAAMNYLVDEKNALPEKVAYDFLKSKGLI